ncbi:MAG: lytic transglycosylase domain-containing protein [Candidatus Eremiobacteraeota bacterium]|nr:lytic transglycosylase domain-containing protein [Candidatus Eremiobacteraeota bacterium]
MTNGVGASARVSLLVLAGLLLHGCVPAPLPPDESAFLVVGPPDVTVLEDRALTWHESLPASELRGLRLLYDTPLAATPTLAVVHSIVRANHRLAPLDALVLATQAVADARGQGLDYGFFCATLLQESAFAPDAFSPAGAVGIAQFTLDTAAAEGVDPFDWRDAMRGSAVLLGRYVAAYDGTYPDPYAAALAAYNAGPSAVAFYEGVPPYAETREYVADIYDRWSRVLHDTAGDDDRRGVTP